VRACGWTVDFYDLTAGPPPALPDGELAGFGDVHGRAVRNGARHGTPVLVDVSGAVDPRINLFFRTGSMAGARAGTWRRYAYALVVWLEFLAVFGRGWDEATARDVEAFKDWRLTDLRNGERVAPTSFDTDRAALNCFYSWAAARYGVGNPVASVRRLSRGPRGGDSGSPFAAGVARDPLRPAGSSRRQVKWMLRRAFEQWRDIGLRGYGFDGLRRPGWSGANEDRDAAFVDGLYGTGLRVIM
jgi:hypothetical protein